MCNQQKEEGDLTHNELIDRIISIQKEVSELHGTLYRNGFTQRIYNIERTVKQNSEHIQHLLSYEQVHKEQEAKTLESQHHQDRMNLGNRRLLLGIIGLLFGNGALILIINYIMERISG